ncbi:MAG: Clp protease ClpP [Methylococcales bacterium]
MNRTNKLAAAVASYWGKDLKQDKSWYSMKGADDNGNAEIKIYDVIGWPFIDAETFLNDLSRMQADTIKVKINSPGGDVFDGTAIYNALADHPAKIITSVEGIAASMASIIALAGNERVIYKNAQFMIHNAWTIAWGDYNDLEKSAELVKSISGQMAETYADKTGKSQKEIQQLMDETTWFTGEESVDFGFMTKAVTAGSTSARFDLSMFENAPQASDPTKRDIERVLTQDAGLSRSQARLLLQGGFESLTKQDAGDDAAVNAVNNLINNLKV